MRRQVSSDQATRFAKPFWKAFSKLSLNRNNLLIPIGLISLVSGRLLLHVLLYRSGFISLSADEFSRTVLAARWAQNPVALWKGAWLPFHIYIFGAAFWLKWDMLLVPRIIVIALGIISILLMYTLTSRLLKSRRIGLISAFMLAANPAHIWLGSTPLTAMPHATFVLAAVLSLISYLERHKQRYIYLGAFMLALANGFRFEAWMLSIVFSFSLVGNGMVRYKRQDLDFRQVLNLILGLIIIWSFPIAWIVGNYVETGNPFYFLESVKLYKLTWYGQSRSFGNYLETFLKIDPYATLLGTLGLVICLLRRKRSWAVRWYVATAVVPFVLFAYLHGGQKEPPGNYFRYLAFFVFIVYPAVALVIDLGVGIVAKSRSVRLSLLALIVIAIGVTQINTAFNFVNDPAAEGLKVGQRIRALRSERPELSGRPALIELSYWQYLAIHVGANDISSILYDRELDTERHQTRSLLITDVETFQTCLSYHNVSHVIVKSPDLRDIVESNLRLLPSEEINGYLFYEIPERLLERDMTIPPPCPLTFDPY